MGDQALATDHGAALIPTLQLLAQAHRQIQRTRLAQANRIGAAERNGLLVPALLLEVLAALKAEEGRIGRMLKRELRKHPLWPWLETLPGLSGPITARLIAIIADPWRFPGRVCAQGHHVSVAYAGDLCPAVEMRQDDDGGDARAATDGLSALIDDDGGGAGDVCGATDEGAVCSAPIGPPRPGTGIASLHHYLGLHVVDGRLPRRQRGVQADWHLVGRVLCLGPQMLADQIILHKTPPYYDQWYVAPKERLLAERGDGDHATEGIDAPLGIDVGEGGEDAPATDAAAAPLSPLRAHRIARTIAVKRFVGDLLTEWKRSQPIDAVGEVAA